VRNGYFILFAAMLRYVLVGNKTQKEVILAIKRARRRVGRNFDKVFKSITADTGSEFLDSEAIKKLPNVVKFITRTLTAAGNVVAMKMAT
jgi:IS30 family transposase